MEETDKILNNLDTVVYMDEDGEKKVVFCDIISTTESLVKFKANSGNIISIPVHRILKIKERETKPETVEAEKCSSTTRTQKTQ